MILNFNFDGPGNFEDAKREAEQSKEALRANMFAAQKAMEYVQAISKLPDMEPTVLPALRLHLFNFLRNDPTASLDDAIQENHRFLRYSELERDLKKPGDPSPTIGLEIEVPNNLFPGDIDNASVLERLNIRTDQEIDGSGMYDFRTFTEVQTDFSYSPWVQSRIAQELVDMKVIRAEPEVGNKKSIKPATFSMHVNFGIPENINSEAIADDFTLMTDIFTFAYVSPQRLLKRKSQSSHSITGENLDKTAKSGNSKGLDGVSKPKRFELRTTEFSGKTTYRMLDEAQAIVGLLIANVKSKKHLPMSFTEVSCAPLYEKFKQQANELMLTKTDKRNIFDRSEFQAEKIAKDPVFVAACRNLISEYSREMRRIAKGAGTTE